MVGKNKKEIGFMILHFSTKGQTLKKLGGIISSAKILPLHIITYRDWQNSKSTEIGRIEEYFSNIGK